MSTVCLKGGIIPLHPVPSHPCPFLCDLPFKGQAGQEHSRGGWPQHWLQGPLLAPGFRGQQNLMASMYSVGGSGRSALQQSPMMSWRLKAWLYPHAAMSCVLMTLRVNYTSFCPGLIDTNSFGWYKLICFQGSLTGGHHSLENLRKKFKVWKPIAAAEKTICRKTESTSNKGRQGEGMQLSKAPLGHSELKSKEKTACKTKSCQWQVQQTAGAKGSSWKQSCRLPSPFLYKYLPHEKQDTMKHQTVLLSWISPSLFSRVWLFF